MSLLPWLASCIPHSGLLKCGNTWIVYPTPTSPPTEAAATAAPGALDSGFAAAASDILLLLLYATASSSRHQAGLTHCRSQGVCSLLSHTVESQPLKPIMCPKLSSKTTRILCLGFRSHRLDMSSVIYLASDTNSVSQVEQ